jgi:uncharacterized protein (TIGR01244 family)
MEVNQLDQQVSVSGQITTDDIVLFLEEGVKVLVCNRPDNESEGQPAYSDIEAAAKKQGLEIINIPFSGGQMQPEQAEAFADLLASGKRIHAYCRTGNRSSQLWSAAKSL